MNNVFKKACKSCVVLLAGLVMTACGSVGSVGPQGPAGPQGPQGNTGESGLTPYIGSNGNWWIGNKDTGVPATGPQGPQGPQGESGEATKPEDKKEVDLFMFMGQSNMAGRGDSKKAPVVKEGHGYEFRAQSDPTKLYNVVEPFGATENDKNAGITENTKTGSMVSSFINEYYKRTNTPVVGVSCSQGGTQSELWQPGKPLLNEAIERHNLAKEYLIKNGYTIRNDFMLWCQGESDGDRNVSKEIYKNRLDNIVNEMMKNGVEKTFIVRIGNQHYEPTLYDDIILAQTEYCQENEKAVMVSTKLAAYAEEGLMPDKFHYTQEAYNIVGQDAAMNAAYYVNTGKEPYMFDPEYKNVYWPYAGIVKPTPEPDPKPEPETPAEKKIEFTFDSIEENGLNFSSLGEVKEGKLTVSKRGKLELPKDKQITISQNESFTLECVSKTGPGGVLLSTGDTTGGFLNIPSDKKDAGNGFTLRDPKRTSSLLFVKDESKFGLKKHLVMTYDKTTKTIKAYEDGVEMPLKNQNGSISTLAPTTFKYMFGGFNTSYDFEGEIYYFRYVNKVLNKSEFVQNQ